ncbi:MAG: UvrD-helicase domain-containing protein [Candidatus Pacebacteria bacterium]|nr:UvrD-helicase domain-containing protein [Candidatus Paceibacterota bacterium]
MKYLEELNSEQKRAVLHKKGPLLILAGAGAGKTRTITYRILHLIKNGVAPENILAVTFTNKTAKEMKEKVLELLRKDKELNLPISFHKQPFIKTFHSLGVYILRENFKELKILKNFSILDKNDSQKIIKEIITSLDLDPKQFEPKKILGIISRQKGKFITISSFIDKISNSSQQGNEYLLKVTAQVWKRYEERLEEEGSLDFDDLLLKTASLLQTNKDVLKKYQDQWQQIHIDEYQDTNKVQYKIVQLLSKKHQNLCVVGDADQNIYSWRGANIQNILNFEKDFKNAETILLEENYRSTQNILSAANQIIQKNLERQEKNLFTKNIEGEKIGTYLAYNEGDEANFVAQKSKNLIEDEKVSPKEIAVLYRTNFQSRILEEAFLNANVPYQVLGTKFFDRKEIKDIIAYLKIALNSKDLTSLKRTINTPARGIGKVTLIKITTGKEEELSSTIKTKVQNYRDILTKISENSQKLKPSDLIKFIISESKIAEQYKLKGTEDDLERLSNIKELVSLAIKYDKLPLGEGLEKLLEEVVLSSDQDEIDDNVGAVRLMTIHSAKGLEFDYVFITGLEDGLFPSKMMGENSTSKAEEERRLFYVALTRARKKLFLAYASMRTIFGSRRTNTVSEFVTDIDENLIEYTDSLGDTISQDTGDEKIEYLEW